MTTAGRIKHRIGIAADHGGHGLKQFLAGRLRATGLEVIDYGNSQLNPEAERHLRRLAKITALETPEVPA